MAKLCHLRFCHFLQHLLALYYLCFVVNGLRRKHGHLPFTKNLTLVQLNPMYHIKGKKKLELNKAEKDELFTKLQQQNFGQAAEVDETSSNKLIESKENK